MIALFFIILFAGTLTAGSIFYQQGVRSPLEAELARLPGVETAAVEPAGGWRTIAPTALRIRLERDADLEQLYPLIEDKIRAAVGHRTVPLVLEDGRTPALTAALGKMKFAMEEALATGAFRRMEEELHAIGEGQGLDEVRVGIDRRFLYVTLRQGDGYLHHVVPRDEEGTLGPIVSVSGTGLAPEKTLGEEVSSDG